MPVIFASKLRARAEAYDAIARIYSDLETIARERGEDLEAFLAADCATAYRKMAAQVDDAVIRAEAQP